jgi:hypothetical protein
MQPTLFRHILSTCMYVVVLFFVLWGNNLLINWALSHVITPFFDWFYKIAFFLKLFLVVFCGTIIGVIIFGVFMWLTSIIGMILSYLFIYNKAIYYISIAMCSLNISISLIDLWPMIAWDFWIIFIWLLIAYFIFQMNWVFVFKDRLVLEMEMDTLEQSRK